MTEGCGTCESKNIYVFDDGFSYACMDCGNTILVASHGKSKHESEVDMTEEE